MAITLITTIVSAEETRGVFNPRETHKRGQWTFTTYQYVPPNSNQTNDRDPGIHKVSTKTIGAGSNDDRARKAYIAIHFISGACKAYTKNQGVYPKDLDELICLTPSGASIIDSYLEHAKTYCGQVVADYEYICHFSSAGYRIIAKPASDQEISLPIYMIDTKGKLQIKDTLDPSWLVPPEEVSFTQAVIKSLEDEDDQIREVANRRFEEIKDASAVPALIDAMKNEKVESIREKAIMALGEIKDASAVPALMDVIRNDKIQSVREKAVWTLGKIGNKQAESFLIDYYYTITNSDFRQIIKTALEEMWSQEDANTSETEEETYAGELKKSQKSCFMESLNLGADKERLNNPDSNESEINSNILSDSRDSAIYNSIDKKTLTSMGMDRLPSEEFFKLWERMVKRLTDPRNEEVAGKLTFILSSSTNNAARPYENYRLGPLYVFPSVGDLQKGNLGREVGFDENWRMIYATKPHVVGPKEYQTEKYKKYAEEYEKREETFKNLKWTHMIAEGRNRKQGEDNYFEIDHTKPLSPIYEWDIIGKDKLRNNKSFFHAHRIPVPVGQVLEFALEINNPLEKPIKNLTICLSADHPSVFEFLDAEVKTIDSLNPGESRKLTWRFILNEHWYEQIKLLVFAYGKPIIASFEEFEVYGVKEEVPKNVKRFSVAKYAKQARNAILNNHPPPGYGGFYDKVARMVQYGHYRHGGVSGYESEKTMVPTRMRFVYETSSLDNGPVEVVVGPQGALFEINYIYKDSSPDIFSHWTHIVSHEKARRIVEACSYMNAEEAILKSKQLKGGSENYIYDHAFADLIKYADTRYLYLWRVTYHYNEDKLGAYYDADFIDPKSGNLVYGNIVVKPKEMDYSNMDLNLVPPKTYPVYIPPKRRMATALFVFGLVCSLGALLYIRLIRKMKK